MLTHTSLILEIQSIRKELNEKLISFADAALEKLNFFQQPSELLESIYYDLGYRDCANPAFSTNFIEYLKVHLD